MKTPNHFEEAYKKLNKAQKQAVDTIDGPVMVVAGPGTGKTQVLALRIANIISSDAQISPKDVLCLTFTNAGVQAMRERLLRLIGSRGSEVCVNTFHRFALGLIEKHYALLDFDAAPVLLADTESVALVDEILEEGEWQHIRPRSDSTKYFADLKSLISLMKREAITPEQFLVEIERDIKNLATNPDNISSRGARKGELKKEIETKIQSLERTREVVRFYESYEALKRERGLMDYDDVLAYAVTLVQNSDDVCAEIREMYLYVLVDEHQDSSGVQNAFLTAVWGDIEQPNIFVVGDDRQLIYGFGGASIEHFTNFRTRFGEAKEITLVQNYRSTQIILDAADALLKSTLATAKLESATGAPESKLVMLECDYPRDEIIFAASEIRKHIEQGVSPNECAILVPKNYQVRSTVATLREQGIPVASAGTVSFFAQPETTTVRNILAVLADPYNAPALGSLLLDPAIGIPPLEAHAFLREYARKINLPLLVQYAGGRLPTSALVRFGTQMHEWLVESQTLGLHALVQKIGEDLFFKDADDHEQLLRQVEVIRTFLHLLAGQQERHEHLSLALFVESLNRIEEYGHEIPLAVFAGASGVRVLTLHGSKGLEFSHVYIAHLDENSLMRGKRGGFSLPERIEGLTVSKNELSARRELYVAITRAKETCTLSYARHSYTGGALEPATILADLPESLLEHKNSSETEEKLLDSNPQKYVSRAKPQPKTTLTELAEIVKNEYSSKNVSVTLLNNFFECPWKWYFRNLLQLPEAKSESLLLGSAVHSGIEYILKNRNHIEQTAIDETLALSLQKECAEGDALIKRVTREAKAILAQFQKTYLGTFATSLQSERSVTYRDPLFAHLSCYGKIDLTEVLSEGVVQVTDFKTGSSKSKSVIEKPDEEERMSSYLRQLAMYTYLITNASKGTEVYACRLLFLEALSDDKDAIYQKTITGDEVELLRKDIQDYDALVRSGEWVRRPCHAKSYGKESECEHCARARVLYS